MKRWGTGQNNSEKKNNSKNILKNQGEHLRNKRIRFENNLPSLAATNIPTEEAIDYFIEKSTLKKV